jgi:hypothetical protein
VFSFLRREGCNFFFTRIVPLPLAQVVFGFRDRIALAQSRLVVQFIN